MDTQPEGTPKAAPVMDVLPPPAPAVEKPAEVPLEAAPVDIVEEAPGEEPMATPPPEQAPEPGDPPEQAKQTLPTLPEEAPQAQITKAKNPALPVIIVTIILMIALSALAVYAYLKSVR